MASGAETRPRRRLRRSTGGTTSSESMDLDSLVERSVREQIHRRKWRLVALDETLAEVSNEVLVGGLWPRSCDAAQALLQLALHLKLGERGENARHDVLRDSLGEEPGVVETRSGGADPGLWLGVGADRQRRVSATEYQRS